ncbi:MAG: hypothetical protein R3B70_03625 [Polyangiaceae bacterium]
MHAQRSGEGPCDGRLRSRHLRRGCRRPHPGDRGWSFSRYVEDYPTGAADAITGIESGSLEVRLDQTMYWFNGTKGYLMYKKIKGDFLVVTDVSTTNGDKSGIPTNEQSGAGILVRDPAGASTDMNGQRWLAVDLGANKQADLTLLQALHISWCKPGMPDICLSNPVVTGVPLSGLIGVCRIGGTYAIWYKQGGTWKEQTSPAGWGQVAMPDEVQVGLFAYASNPPGDSPDGVIGTFPSVHQIDLEKGCEPSKYE